MSGRYAAADCPNRREDSVAEVAREKLAPFNVAGETNSVELGGVADVGERGLKLTRPEDRSEVERFLLGYEDRARGLRESYRDLFTDTGTRAGYLRRYISLFDARPNAESVPLRVRSSRFGAMRRRRRRYHRGSTRETE